MAKTFRPSYSSYFTITLFIAISLAVTGCSNGEYSTPVDPSEPNPPPYEIGEEGKIAALLADQLVDREIRLGRELASGADFELLFVEADTEAEIEIINAESTDDEILRVEQINDDHLRLEAVEEGSATLKMSATVGDEGVIDDGFGFTTSIPSSVDFFGCSNAERPVVLVEESLLIRAVTRNEAGDEIASFGLTPFQIEPSDAAVVGATNRTRAEIEILVAGEPQSFALKSKFDDTEMFIDAIEPGDVNDLVLVNPSLWKPPPTIQLGEGITDFAWSVSVRPAVDGQPICNAELALEATTDTPEICSVAADGSSSTDVEAKDVGTCEFALTFPAGNDGQGVSKQLTAFVEE